MAEEISYTEVRSDPQSLRQSRAGPLRSGYFEYPAYPFRTPPELHDKTMLSPVGQLMHIN